MVLKVTLDLKSSFSTEIDIVESFRVNRGYRKHITTRGKKSFPKPASKNTTISRGLPVPHLLSESDRVSRSWCQFLSAAPVKKRLEEVSKKGRCHSPCLMGILLGRLYPSKVSEGRRN